jgi:hypothetical protein
VPNKLLYLVETPLTFHVDDLQDIFNYYSFIILSGVRLSPFGTASTTGLLYQLQMTDDGVCEVVCGRKIGRGNRSILRKPANMSTTNPT